MFFLGFAPGFAYLGPLPDADRDAAPRRRRDSASRPAASASPAPRPAVYPFAMPGGWRIIGRTDAPMWDLAGTIPSLLRPGDRVRFVPIG